MEKDKGKVILLQARCGPEGGQRYSSLLFLDRGTRRGWVTSLCIVRKWNT